MNEKEKSAALRETIEQNRRIYEKISVDDAPLTDAIRGRLASLLAKETLRDDVAEMMAQWCRDANFEGLREWLAKDGWDKVNADQVEGRLIKATKAAAPSNWPNWAGSLIPFSIVFGEHADNAPAVAALDLPRNGYTAEKRDRLIAFCDAENTPNPNWTPDDLSQMWGFDALKYMIDDRFLLWKKDNTLDYAVAAVLDEKNDWLGLLVAPWFKERAEQYTEAAERREKARTLEAVPRVEVAGHEFGRLPKVAAGMSWAFGGVGLHPVEVDGRTYAPAPDVSINPEKILLPAGYDLLPADHKARPHQTLLPLDVSGDDDAPPLPVALANSTRYAMTPAAGKLGLLVMAAAWAARGLHKTTLRELTQQINPDARLVKTHFKTVLDGLENLDGLRLVLPDGMTYRVFDCPIPWRELTPAEYDLPLFVGMTRTFEKTLAAIQTTAGKSYKGDFLFDVTGSMALPTKRPALLRQYIRACAFWNAAGSLNPTTKGEFDLRRLPDVSAERWAAMTNYLSPTAAEYLRAKHKGGDRRQAAKEVKEIIRDAEELEALHLVKIDKAERKALRLLPPEPYLEAWRESRKGAHRMPKA